MARHASWQVPAVWFLGSLALVFLFPLSSQTFLQLHFFGNICQECQPQSVIRAAKIYLRFNSQHEQSGHN